MAFLTVSSSPRNCMGRMGFRFVSNSYTMGMPVGKFNSMMASSDIPGDREGDTDRYEMKRNIDHKKMQSYNSATHFPV